MAAMRGEMEGPGEGGVVEEARPLASASGLRVAGRWFSKKHQKTREVNGASLGIQEKG